jgi:hypothetical protein
MQQGHPIAYVSKSLGPKLRGLSTYEKVYIAILMVVDQWRHYLIRGACPTLMSRGFTPIDSKKSSLSS